MASPAAVPWRIRTRLTNWDPSEPSSIAAVARRRVARDPKEGAGNTLAFEPPSSSLTGIAGTTASLTVPTTVANELVHCSVNSASMPGTPLLLQAMNEFSHRYPQLFQ